MRFDRAVPKPNFGSTPAEHAVEMILSRGAFAFQGVYTSEECDRLLEAIGPHESIIVQDPKLTGRLTESGIRSGVIPPETDDLLMASLRELERSIVEYFSCTNALPDGFTMTMPGVQIYPSGCTGLPKHRDLKRYRKIVLNLCLRGDTIFNVWSRDGELTTYPVRRATLVAMAAPGFCGQILYPEHSVDRMPQGRVILVAREES